VEIRKKISAKSSTRVLLRVLANRENVRPILNRDPLPLDLVLRKRICYNIYRRQSFVNRFRKSLGYSTNHLLKGLGVTFELVGRVPATFGDANESAEQEKEEQQEGGEGGTEETFFDDYAQAVTAVETLLSLERLRQEDLVLDLVARSEMSVGGGGGAAIAAPAGELRKTLSIPSFGGSAALHRGVGAASSTMSLNVMGRSGMTGSLTSLSLQDSRRVGGGSRRSLAAAPATRAPSLEESRKRLSLPSGVVMRASHVGKNGGSALRKSMMTLLEEDGGGENKN
jgi:hypothetical protein